MLAKYVIIRSYVRSYLLGRSLPPLTEACCQQLVREITLGIETGDPSHVSRAAVLLTHLPEVKAWADEPPREDLVFRPMPPPVTRSERGSHASPFFSDRKLAGYAPRPVASIAPAVVPTPPPAVKPKGQKKKNLPFTSEDILNLRAKLRHLTDERGLEQTAACLGVNILDIKNLLHRGHPTPRVYLGIVNALASLAA